MPFLARILLDLRKADKQDRRSRIVKVLNRVAAVLAGAAFALAMTGGPAAAEGDGYGRHHGYGTATPSTPASTPPATASPSAPASPAPATLPVTGSSTGADAARVAAGLLTVGGLLFAGSRVRRSRHDRRFRRGQPVG